MAVAIFLVGLLVVAVSRLPLFNHNDPSTYGSSQDESGCNTIAHGYNCDPSVSHFWGQYSPFFSVPSDIDADVPRKCSVTFAQILSRHGARDPTASKTTSYNATVHKIQSEVSTFTGPYAFLKDYQYTLGADMLTAFGEQGLVDSGIKFFQRYKQLATRNTPFVRSAGEARVVQSAFNWTQGFHTAKVDSGRGSHSGATDKDYPYPILVIPEDDGVNNTLNHGLCTAFEDGPDADIGDEAKGTWADIFVPPIQKRLNKDLPGANLSKSETIYMMDLCPFNTVASPNGTISPFCNLFSEEEWHQYSYYETLDKWYGHGFGNPLGPTQGVGFVNELIARLTSKPVNDETTTNHTLDSNPVTFPLHKRLYADFSHDNDMTGIFAALGLYNRTSMLPNTTVVEPQDAGGYSAGWTVPFAARMYVEKMRCFGEREELVRILVNDRVQPLEQCGGDHLGRCTLSAFVDSLGFARSGGEWDQCFT
ncbi:acid phosphatase [Polychaeton citri CBS 116435]|uniref:Phytase A n=1 Tax=Polychaeton citri CBS 116435 TaxID=1314669 RepID=A0A9P4PWY5_9PEZI|nr:acid phosphatase [Polychaeton citri CBS 116435]